MLLLRDWMFSRTVLTPHTLVVESINSYSVQNVLWFMDTIRITLLTIRRTAMSSIIRRSSYIWRRVVWWQYSQHELTDDNNEDKTSVLSNLARGRIAVLSPLVTIRMDSSNLDPQVINGPFPKRHFDQHNTSVSPTHRHTDHATCDICSNRPHVRYACMRCSLKPQQFSACGCRGCPGGISRRRCTADQKVCLPNRLLSTLAARGSSRPGRRSAGLSAAANPNSIDPR